MSYASSVQVHVRLAQLYRPTVRHALYLMPCIIISVSTPVHHLPSITLPLTPVPYANTHA